MAVAGHVCGPGCGHITRFTDRQSRAGAGSSGPRGPMVKTTSAEGRYVRQLRKVAAEVGRIVEGFPIGDPIAVYRLQATLRRYSEIVEPWATTVADLMLKEVEARDRRAWVTRAREISRGLARELEHSSVGAALRDMLAEQVRLITSLPIEAGERVHELTLKGLSDSTRAAEIAKEIARTGEVTASRATLIARTEVARTASALVQARSQSIGIQEYVWRTSRDEAVRSAHRAMEGVSVGWDTPPKLSDGTTTHAGQIFNCRCWPEPILPSRF
jgi:SPP1 gp7 family putative phage head morphogenesis protein